MRRMTKASGAIAIAVVGALLGGVASTAVGGSDWNSAGGNLQNTRFQANEKTLSVSNVDDLEVKWEFTTGGDVSATPAVVGDTVYFPDRAGNLYAVDKWTGQQRWRASIAAASGVAGDYARATPAIAGNKVIIGTQGPFGGGGKVLAFDKNTGALLWSTTLDTHPAAIITQSATVFGNRVYVGTSSLEESFALIPGYHVLLVPRPDGGARCEHRRRRLAGQDVAAGLPRQRGVGELPGDRPEAGTAVRRHRQQLRRAAGDAGVRRRRRQRPGGAAGLPASRQPLRFGVGARPEDGRDPVGDASDGLRRVDGGLHPVHRRGDQLPRAGGTRLRFRPGTGAVHGQGRQRPAP